MGFRSLVSLLPAIQATRLLAFALVGLSPTERASLRWTHHPRAGWRRSSAESNPELRDPLTAVQISNASARTNGSLDGAIAQRSPALPTPSCPNSAAITGRARPTADGRS